MMPKKLLILLLFSVSLVLTGCKNSLLDRSLIFSTHTTMGLEVSFSPAESGGPAKLIVGYNRTEGVINPVYHSDGINTSDRTEKASKTRLEEKSGSGTPQDPNQPETGNFHSRTEEVSESDQTSSSNPTNIPRYRDHAYSVIAKFRGKTGGKAGTAAQGEMSVAQWFATGEAALIIAEQPGIAGAVTGSSEIARASAGQPRFAADLEGLNQDYAFIIVGNIYKGLGQLSKDGDKEAEQLVAKLDGLANNLSLELFRHYDFNKSSDPNAKSVLTETVRSLDTNGFLGLISLRAKQEEAKRVLERACANTPFELENKIADPSKKTEVNDENHVEYKRLQKILAQKNTWLDNLDDVLSNDDVVIDAVEYYISIVTGQI